MKKIISALLCLMIVLSSISCMGTFVASAINATPVAGDINGDGNANNKDLTRLMKYLAGEEVEVTVSTVDPNGDGVTNNKDLTRLMRYLAGDSVEIFLSCTHEIEKIEEKEASCKAEGNIACWHCGVCNKYFSDADGKNEVVSDEIVVEAKGHTPVEDSAVAPTYESTGLTVGSHCSVCNEVLQPQTVIPMLKKTEYAITYYPYNGDEYLQVIGVENNNPSVYATEDGLTLKNLNVAGYKFLGWYDLPSGANAKNIKTIPAGTTGEFELYAHWEKIEYSIQFDSELVAVDEMKYTTDKNTTLPKPTLDGYIFVGWSDSEGNLFKNVPAGTTGNKNYTANWLSERNKAWTKNNIDDPIIIEDEATDTILFTYEIGRIENVPMYTIEDFGYINSEGVTREISKEYTIRTEKTLMEQYSKNVANSTTNSSQWSLSNGWSDTVTVNENYLKEQGFSETDAKTICATDSENWLVSSGSSGSTTTNKYASSQEYDLITETDNKKTYNTEDKTNSKTHKQSAELDVGVNIKVVDIGGSIGYEGSNTDSTAAKTGTETDDGTDTQTGSVKHTGTDTVSSGGWNKSSSYGGSKTVSETDSISNTISERIAAEYGYGKSYIKTGDETTSRGLSSSTSISDTYSSAVTYSIEESVKESITYTTSNTKTGYHRLVKAGTAHVFAVVGYDIKSASYFVSTYTVMDDEIHTFEDYSYSSAAYDDNQTGVISFEVPYFVEEYVLSKVGETEGLEISKSGIVTGYHGTESTVFVPEYHVIDNLDDSRSVVKVVGMNSSAFVENKAVTGIILSDYITEIPENSFNGLSNLSFVKMPGVTSISDGAFLNCPQIDYIYLSDNVTSLGNNVFDNMNKVVVCASNAGVINGTLSCDSENITILISDKCTDLNDMSIKISDNVECFTFNGYGKTFNNLYIDSDAQKTVINRANFVSTGEIPLITSSKEVELNQVTITSNGIGLALTTELCQLGLYGESSVSSLTGNAMLCNKIDVYQIKNDLTTVIYISGNMLIADEDGAHIPEESPELNPYFNITNGDIKYISKDGYNKYLNGTVEVSFDASEGVVSETVKTVYYGSSIGALPVPTREYYTFNGWFTQPVGGTMVTEDTVVDSIENRTLYAQWTRNTFNVNFNANGGTLESESNRMVAVGMTYGELPVPTRANCTFDGWYDENDELVTAETVFFATDDVTLKAHWSSGWILASNLPEDGEVTSEQWTYTSTKTTSSKSSTLSGWTYTHKERTGWGSTQGPLTYDPSNGERNVWTQNDVVGQRTHYVYYHRYSNGKWSDDAHASSWAEHAGPDVTSPLPNGYYSSTTGQRYTGEACSICGATNQWHLKRTYTEDIKEKRWYYQEPVYTYHFKQVNELVSATEITTSDAGTNETISNIQKWVKYTVQ